MSTWVWPRADVTGVPVGRGDQDADTGQLCEAPGERPGEAAARPRLTWDSSDWSRERTRRRTLVVAHPPAPRK